MTTASCRYFGWTTRHWKNYAMLLTPPNGAVTGNVYATLHDGAAAAVMLGSVRLFD